MDTVVTVVALLGALAFLSAGPSLQLLGTRTPSLFGTRIPLLFLFDFFSGCSGSTSASLFRLRLHLFLDLWGLGASLLRFAAFLPARPFVPFGSLWIFTRRVGRRPWILFLSKISNNIVKKLVHSLLKVGPPIIIVDL